jgi:hypothetical protein
MAIFYLEPEACSVCVLFFFQFCDVAQVAIIHKTN